MCIAIYKPANSIILFEDLERAFEANPDGAGFAVRRDGTVHIIKGLMTFDHFKARFIKHANYECIIHFRWASMGEIGKDNCHPFALPDGSALIHNGHIQGYGNKRISDTRDYVDNVLSPLVTQYPDILRHGAMREVLDRAIGSSRMAILPITGKAIIIGEARGKWHDGSWYSSPIPSEADLDKWSRYTLRTPYSVASSKPASPKAVLAEDLDKDDSEPTRCMECGEKLTRLNHTADYYGTCDYCAALFADEEGNYEPSLAGTHCLECGESLAGTGFYGVSGLCEICSDVRYAMSRKNDTDEIPF
jgi:hypothetical protein